MSYGMPHPPIKTLCNLTADNALRIGRMRGFYFKRLVPDSTPEQAEEAETKERGWFPMTEIKARTLEQKDGRRVWKLFVKGISEGIYS